MHNASAFELGIPEFALIPAIDLRDGQVVRLRQGDFGQETVYHLDPAEVAASFVEAGARRLHVVDLDGARTGTRTNSGAVAAVVAGVGDRAEVEVAGGIRDEATAAAVLALGASRVVIGTGVLVDPSLAARLVAAHGADRVVAAIDVRDGVAVGHGWVARTVGSDVASTVLRLADNGIEGFEVTAIDRDGLLQGPDLDLYERLIALRVGSIIASGGIAAIVDLMTLRDSGCSGAIVGRALYEGRVDLGEAIEAVAHA